MFQPFSLFAARPVKGTLGVEMNRSRKVLLMLVLLFLMAMSTSAEVQTQNNNPEVKVVKIPSTSGSPINGLIYGNGSNVVILSNMDPNDLESWAPLVPALVVQKHSVFSYTYSRDGTERVKDLLEVIDFVQSYGFSKIVLIGACRGGVISIQVAANNNSQADIVAVAALAVPIQYEGTTFYSSKELRSIAVPKLLINSVGDYSADDSRKIHELFIEPKAISFYSGDEHGTDIFNNPDHKKALVKQLADFVSSSL